MGSLINLLLNVLLIPIIGQYGAAISSLIAEVSILILYVNGCDGYLSFLQIFQYSYKKILAGSVMALVIVVARCFGNISSIVLLSIQIVGGGLVYFIMLFLTRDSGLQLIIGTVIDSATHKTR